MSGRLIAIGDVHGCDRALAAIVEAVSPSADDTLVPLGDFIDRGPQPRGAVEQLLELDSRCRLRPLLGNHEQMLLQVLAGELPPLDWIPYGAPATLDSYGFAGDLSCIPQEHVRFLEACLPYHETDDWFFVHANYDAALPLAEQPDRLLRWTSLEESFPAPHVSGKTAVVGHTAQKDGRIFDHGYLRCLDTFCYGGGKLTAMDLASGQVWQADQEGHVEESVANETSGRG